MTKALFACSTLAMAFAFGVPTFWGAQSCGDFDLGGCSAGFRTLPAGANSNKNPHSSCSMCVTRACHPVSSAAM